MAGNEPKAPHAVTLVEEAVHLLRGVPIAWWALYAAGVLPWTAAVLWGWARITWFAPGDTERALLALGMVGLFFWLKGLQALSAARLLAWRAGREPAAWSWRAVLRVGLAQFRLQAWGLIVLPVAAAVVLPLGWVMAYYQSATVIGEGNDLEAETRRRAADSPGQNHLGLVWIGLFAVVVWVNVASCAVMLPWLANRLLGVENLLPTRGVVWFNSTYLAVVTLLAWLAMDPLIKAFYVLRVFYGRARATGEDLRVELLAVKAAGRRRVAALVAVGLSVAAAMGPWASSLAAQEATPATRAMETQEFDTAIDEALHDRDFQWRLRPVPRERDEEAGFVARFFQDGIEALREMVRTTRDWFQAVDRWLNRGGREATPVAVDADGDGAGGGGWWKAILYLLLALLVGLFGWVVWLAIRRAGRSSVAEVAASPVAAAVPDLSDDRVHAAQLPVDGWLKLARERMLAGDWRLALRALYLARLARLGREGWLRLHKAKTNLDYERELVRRVGHRGHLVDGFRGARRTFEGVWYGREEARRETVEEWLASLSADAATAGGGT